MINIDSDENLIVEVDRELMDKDTNLEAVNTANGIDANGRLSVILRDSIVASMWWDYYSQIAWYYNYYWKYVVMFLYFW